MISVPEGLNEEGLIVISGVGCASCETMKKTLEEREIPYKEVDVFSKGVLVFMQQAGVRTLPQLVQDGVILEKGMLYG